MTSSTGRLKTFSPALTKDWFPIKKKGQRRFHIRRYLFSGSDQPPPPGCLVCFLDWSSFLDGRIISNANNLLQVSLSSIRPSSTQFSFINLDWIPELHPNRSSVKKSWSSITCAQDRTIAASHPINIVGLGARTTIKSPRCSQVVIFTTNSENAFTLSPSHRDITSFVLPLVVSLVQALAVKEIRFRSNGSRFSTVHFPHQALKLLIFSVATFLTSDYHNSNNVFSPRVHDP